MDRDDEPRKHKANVIQTQTQTSKGYNILDCHNQIANLNLSMMLTNPHTHLADVFKVRPKSGLGGNVAISIPIE